ncbi:MAG: fatty acid desaturase [Geminicoccaceae bacterium]|nr:fatty acid desaturase [Geminicoccaceae bacterium]
MYTGFFLLTWWWSDLPLALALGAGAVLLAWHGSLQHEATHGQLAPVRWLNDLPALPPLSLWVPYPIYRSTHRAHHDFEILTDPWRDPESFYVDRTTWQRLPTTVQRLLVFYNTLLGRLTVGPALVIGQFWWMEIRALARGDRRNLSVWLAHLPLVALVVGWLLVLGVPLWAYALMVYGGASLTLVRSFAEHKAAHTPYERTAVVEAGRFFSILFLNNNLHYAHHRRPDLPWHALPAYWRAHRVELLKENGGLLYRAGYLEIFRRFLLRPVDRPVHPYV